MNKYKIIWKNGKEVITTANNTMEIMKKYDLFTKENIRVHVIKLN